MKKLIRMVSTFVALSLLCQIGNIVTGNDLISKDPPFIVLILRK